MNTNDIQYSVVVPVFRGRDTLPNLCARLRQAFAAAGAGFEIILVDDASRDGTADTVRRLAETDPAVTGVFLARNFGQHNATVEGFRHCRGKFVITLDEDLEHLPEEIGTLLAEQARTGADVVYGNPVPYHHSPWRGLASRLVKRVSRHAGQDFQISSFRLLSATVARHVAESRRHDIILDLYLTWHTDRITGVSVRRGQAGRDSSYSLGKLVSLVFDLFCGYTVLPLRASMGAGIVLSLVALLTGTRAIYWKLTGAPDIDIGYTSIFVAITFTGGLVLIALGVVSEYLSRVFLQVAHKPQTVVREVVGRP